jgi:hypothetical protein
MTTESTTTIVREKAEQLARLNPNHDWAYDPKAAVVAFRPKGIDEPWTDYTGYGLGGFWYLSHSVLVNGEAPVRNYIAL